MQTFLEGLKEKLKFDRISDIPIKIKLIAYAVFCIFWIFVIVTSGGISIGKILNGNKFMSEVNNIVKEVKETQILQKTYLQHFTDEEKTKVKKQAQKFIIELDKIKKSNPLAVEKMINIAKEYQTKFNTVNTVHTNLEQKGKELTVPLNQARSLIKHKIEEILTLQAERQMEGEELTVIESELLTYLNAADVFGLVLESVQQKFLMTNDEKYLKEFQETLDNNGEVTAIDALEQVANSYPEVMNMNEVKPIKDNIEEFAKKAVDVQAVIQEEKTSIEEMEESISQIIDHAEKLLDKTEKSIKADIVGIIVSITIIVLIIIIVISAQTYYLTIMITKPMAVLLENASLISNGDLSKPIDVNRKDELGILGKTLEQMRSELNNIVRNLQQATNQISKSTEEVSATSEETNAKLNSIAEAMESVSDASLEQVRSVEEISHDIDSMIQNINGVSDGAKQQTEKFEVTNTSVEQNDQALQQVLKKSEEQTQKLTETREVISNMVQVVEEVVNKANSVETISIDTVEVANNGKTIVKETVQGMSNIKNAVDDVREKITELGQRSSQIGEIIELIDDISEQTNLLALNAAIEAARAGEHGKGFAVVADEVRKLAERSSSATKEIAQLIKAIQNGTSAAVSSMEQGNTEVQNGVELITKTQSALENIADAIQNTVTHIKEINVSAGNMSSSSSNAASTMDQIYEIVEGNTKYLNDLLVSFKEVVGSIKETQKIAASNQTAATSMISQSETVNEKMGVISNATNNTSAVSEEVVASTREIKETMDDLSSKASNLLDISKDLSGIVDRFKI